MPTSSEPHGMSLSPRAARRSPGAADIGSLYLRWSATPRPPRTRITAMIAVVPVFLGLLPALVGGVGRRIDRRAGLPGLTIGVPGQSLGMVLAAVGFSLGVWSVAAEMGPGSGTPLPVLPTQRLLTDGPFRYCRNPMTLGAILAYVGIALMARTPAGVGIALSLAGALLAYLKLLEEPELADRFGDAYLAYRTATPFMVPRLRARGDDG